MLVCTDPKLRLDGVTVSAPGMTAVAVSGTATFALVALDAIERVPFKLTADCGAQVMVTFAVWLGARVMGMPMLLMLKPLPDTLAWVRVILEPPELVNVAEAFWLLPTVTLPKATGLLLTASTPGVTGVADKVTLRVGFAALLTMLTFPFAVPADCGANITLKLAL